MAYFGKATTHAFVNFNSSGSQSIRHSYGYSSIGDNGTCDQTFHFATSYGSTDYGWTGSAGFSSVSQQVWLSSPSNVGIGTWKQAGSLRLRAVYGNQASNIDPHDWTVSILGNV